MTAKFITFIVLGALGTEAHGDDEVVALVERLVKPKFKMSCLVTTRMPPNKPMADSLRKEAAEQGTGLAVKSPETVDQIETGQVIMMRRVIEATGPFDYKASITRLNGINEGWVWEYYATKDTGLFEKHPSFGAKTNATLPEVPFRDAADGFPAAALTSYLGNITEVEKVRLGDTTVIKAFWTPSREHWLEIVLNEEETAIAGLRKFLNGNLSDETEIIDWGEAADGTPVPLKSSLTRFNNRNAEWTSKETWDFETLTFDGIDPTHFRYVGPKE